MITAEEARDALGLLGVAPAIEVADKAVRKAVEEGQTSVIIRSPEIFGGGYKGTVSWNALRNELDELGFHVECYYREGSSFVDIGTKISWE